MQRATRPFAVYIHYPYCSSLCKYAVLCSSPTNSVYCSYCNFNKYVAKKEDINTARLEEAYITAIDRALGLLLDAQDRPVQSVYFGGGTPSLAPPRLIGSIVDHVLSRCKTETPGPIEVTLEANPGSAAERARLHDYRAAGVNRLSLGVQSLRDDALVRLGRRHTVKDARDAWTLACSLFPGRTSLDLMWGRPGQTLRDWRGELAEAIELAAGHMSLYNLILEKGTKLEREHRRDPSGFPKTDEVDQMYAATVEQTAKAGYEQYEVSSFAKTSDQQSRHNSAYWKGLDYLGVGPGAHGRFFVERSPAVRERRIQILQPELWMSDIEAGGDGSKVVKEIEGTGIAEELLMLGMQLRQGVDAERFLEYTGRSLLEAVNAESAMTLARDGFIEVDARGIRPTARGMFVIDSLVPRLLKH